MSKNNSDGTIVINVKSPGMPRGTSARMLDSLTAAQAVAELRRTPPKDANGARVLQQLEREMSVQHDFLVVTSRGAIAKIDPQKTTLRELAVPRELRTSRGLEIVPVVAFEVQAYAPVGL